MPFRLARSASCAKPGLSLLLAAALAANGAVAPLAYAASPAEIRVGRAPGFSRLDLYGELAVRRDGDAVIVRFPGAGPNLARLHVDPPPFVKLAVAHTVGASTEVKIVATPGAMVSVGQADGRSFINFRGPADAAPAPTVTQAASHLDAAPPGGVSLAPSFKDGVLTLRFPWRAPVGAAVFRRGETVWVVFDAKAKLNLGGAPHGLPQAKRFDAVDDPSVSALRINSPAALPVSAHADGTAWVVTIGGASPAVEPMIAIDRESDGSAALIGHTPAAGGVFWLRDPEVGDRLAIVTAGAPPAGASARAFVDAKVLASAHGLAVQPTADDLVVTTEGEQVRIGRPKGLMLSQPAALAVALAARPSIKPLEMPKPANLPGLIDFVNWSKTGEGGFLKRYDALLAAAADEMAAGKGAGVEARLGLARFLVGSQLSAEAIGVLNVLAKQQPLVTASAEFRGLRGAAKVMARRWKDAEADFSAPPVVNDPAAALWRGYAAAKEGDAATARTQFLQGRIALDQVAPLWRARFATAAAGAAVSLNDAASAHVFLSAGGDGQTTEDRAEQTLVRARLAEAEGRGDEALALYDGLSRDPYGAVAAPALLKAVDLKLARVRMPAAEAVATLDSIRFRWRGDATELEVVRELGQVDLRQGRYREALEAWRSAGTRMADLPVASVIRTDMGQAFRDLFLGGRADSLEPVQALALFYDFKDNTPIGADGDLMVRRLVRRLVDVDLLDQASDLLKYQVTSRLEGPAKAQVATDLALVYLMDRKPEDALGAINDSRSTLLPNALNLQRRVIEARALIDLNRNDHALEVLGADTSPEAIELRALAAWRARDWAATAKYSEARLGDRWKKADPLTAGEAAFLLRAGVGMTLSKDEAGLARLREHYGHLTESAPNPDAMRVALAGLNTAPGAGLITAINDADTFTRWVARMKARFRDAPSAPAPVHQEAAAASPTPELKKG